MNFTITIITAILGSGFISTIISHLFYTWKLKREQSMKADYGAGVKIAKALLEVKEFLQYGNNIEIYDADEVLRAEKFNAVEGNIIYPEILNDKSTLEKTMDELREIRKKYELYFDCKTALHIVLIDRYLAQLMLFMKKYSNEFWPVWGTIFITDIQTIFHLCDRRVTKRINKQKYKLEQHYGTKWNRLRKRLLVKPFEESFLARMENERLSDEEKAIVSKIFSNIEQRTEGN